MAKRRSLLQKIAGGLGEGITNVSSVYMRQRLQEKMQDRYDDRMEARDTRTAKRQSEAATQKELDEILDSIIKGDTDSPQGAKRIGLRTGKEPPLDVLDAMRPSPTRRLDKRFGPEISSANSAEELPQEGDIASFGRGDRMEIPGQVGFKMTEPEGFESMEPDPLGSLDPAVRELAGNVGARRRAFMEKPTERLEVTNPDLSKDVKFVPTYTSQQFRVAPNASTVGAAEGERDKANLGVSGPAKAAQAGAVAGATSQATESVESSPAATTARIAEHVEKIKQAFPYTLELAKAQASINANNAITTEQGKQTAEMMRAASQLTPFFTKLADLTQRINTREGPSARIVGAMRAGQAMMGDDPEVVQMDQLIAQHLRPLAVMMGVTEANVSNTETEQALVGIGLKAWSTSKERVNALRNLQDLMTIGPVVARSVDINTPIGPRMELARKLMESRRSAEGAAIQKGGTHYWDPVTKNVIPVIK